MRHWIERIEQFAINVILGRRYGKRASILRGVLWLLSELFYDIVQFRLWLYRKRLLHDRSLGCLVISVGNLTVGGTGKTPVVEKLARTLQANGRNVAILSRGYKSRREPFFRRVRSLFYGRVQLHLPRVVSDGHAVYMRSREAGDEPYMLAKNLPGVPVVVDKDRVKCGRYAVNHFGADTLILDDGFQYLHLRHRLDIVLIDHQSPFGNEFLLPRGTLREPPKNLERAHYILITKSPESPKANQALIKRIRQYNQTAEIIQCAHKPQHLCEVYGNRRLPLEALEGRACGAFSGIATPESFEVSLEKLGAHVELSRQFIDHHRFCEEEIRAFAQSCKDHNIDMIITTEKDAVRFPASFSPILPVPVFYLRVEIEILAGHDSWQNCIEKICKPEKVTEPSLIKKVRST